MDFSWMLEDDDIEDSIFYGIMPYGSPGEESLRLGMQTVLQSKERWADLNLIMYAQRKSLNADPSGRVDVIDDSGVDVATNYAGQIRPKGESVSIELDVAFNGNVLKYEPKDVVLVAVAPVLLAALNIENDDDRKDTHWIACDEATPVAHTYGSHEVVRTVNLERKPRTKQHREVSRGIHKSPNKTGQPFRVPLFHQDCLHPVVLQRCPKSVKGLTMCLRTLLRQLLAGSGWIVEAGIRKTEALCLIRRLLGQELGSQVQLDLPITDAPHLTDEWREMHYTAVLANIISLYTGTKITSGELDRCFILYTRYYSLSSRFLGILGTRQWPPQLPNEEELCGFGCYRPGDSIWTKQKAKKCKVENCSLPSNPLN